MREPVSNLFSVLWQPAALNSSSVYGLIFNMQVLEMLSLFYQSSKCLKIFFKLSFTTMSYWLVHYLNICSLFLIALFLESYTFYQMGYFFNSSSFSCRICRSPGLVDRLLLVPAVGTNSHGVPHLHQLVRKDFESLPRKHWQKPERRCNCTTPRKTPANDMRYV